MKLKDPETVGDFLWIVFLIMVAGLILSIL